MTINPTEANSTSPTGVPHPFDPSADGCHPSVASDLCDDSHSWPASVGVSVEQTEAFPGSSSDIESVLSVVTTSDIRASVSLLCAPWKYRLACVFQGSGRGQACRGSLQVVPPEAVEAGLRPCQAKPPLVLLSRSPLHRLLGFCDLGLCLRVSQQACGWPSGSLSWYT